MKPLQFPAVVMLQLCVRMPQLTTRIPQITKCGSGSIQWQHPDRKVMEHRAMRGVCTNTSKLKAAPQGSGLARCRPLAVYLQRSGCNDNQLPRSVKTTPCRNRTSSPFYQSRHTHELHCACSCQDRHSSRPNPCQGWPSNVRMPCFPHPTQVLHSSYSHRHATRTP